MAMEGKRRTRPTWAQVRELEDKLADQIEGTSRLVADCDGWRELYREKCTELKLCKLGAKLMSDKFNKQEKGINLLKDSVSRLREKIERLMSRGFWARVFNRDV